MGVYERRRPRPVAGVPIEGLGDGVALAKAWLLELLAAAPLDAAAAVPAGRLAQEAPGLCASILAALSSDAELERLTAAPATGRAAARAGAGAPADAAAAIESLRTAIWNELQRRVRDDPELAAGVADRLAHVCAAVLEAALAVADGAPASTEHDPGAAAVGAPEVVPRAERFGRRPRVADAGEAVEHAGLEPWRAAIARRLERHAEDGRPFAVLALEVDDLDRLLAAQTGTEVEEALEAAERALTGELAPADVIVRERLGRYWLIAPDTDEPAGRDLGERLAGSIAGAVPLGLPPLTASIGLASCPTDGTTADQLATHADEGVFAARAAGVPVA